MKYKHLPESQLTLYAEILDQSIQAAAGEAADGALKGSFISKEIKGRTYWYLQRSHGEKKHQIYLGPNSPPLLGWIERAKGKTADIATDRKNLVRLSRMLVSGGATGEPASILKALRLLSDSRVFQLGGVLIGTLAFRAYANMLGVRFERSTLQTQDLDIAQDRTIGVALARETSAINLEDEIEASGLDLHPVPPLDPKRSSTSFKVRGRDLRIDFLTPMKGKETQEPVFLPAFKLSAQPLRHLDYLLNVVTQAVVLGSDSVLVNLPDPARFALHKLWTSTRRPTAFQTKAMKDALQAEQLIEVLLDERPDDLEQAWRSLPTKNIQNAVSKAAGKLDLELQERLRSVTSD